MPMVDLKAQFATIRAEVMAAVQAVMESQQFILGQEVRRFEQELAAMIDARAAVGCGSGSDALMLALMALGIGPGDEVITTPFTFIATAAAIARVGAKPVFADIRPDTFNLDPELISSVLTPRTRAIIAVHLFGLPADLAPILDLGRRHGLAVIEDAAQAIGARYKGKWVGALGTLGCFSFFPSKNLGAGGDAGSVATMDMALAHRLKLLREHGTRGGYYHEMFGVNSRLDEIQAAILRVKLRYLSRWTAQRQHKAVRYRELLTQRGLDSTIRSPAQSPGSEHVYNQFVIRCDKRDELRQFLLHRRIPSAVYYPLPLHLQPAFAYLGHQHGEFPYAEAASREVLALPLYPELSDQQQTAVVDAIERFVKTGS